jgi:Pectate lyase superfamily protein
MLSTPAPASATIRNVQSYGAKGDGTTDDTAAINSAIAALRPGDTLLFPCTSNSTYLINGQLSINVTNVTVDGSSCAIIQDIAASGNIFVIGNISTGPAIALFAVAYELSTSFTTTSPLGVNPGDYVYIHQGGLDYSTDTPPGHPTNCDVSGCRGEMLKVASVNGNTVTITTALHDTYDPTVNGAVVEQVLSPLAGMTVQNITLNGSGTENDGLVMLEVVDSTVTGVTAGNVLSQALYGAGDFNLVWNNVTVTRAGNASGAAMALYVQGNPSVNGASISNLNAATAAGAPGFQISGTAGGTFANIIVDASGAYGRPFKTTAARWNTFNSITAKNGSLADNNGISLEYYSSHNIFNNCVVTNNGTAGIGTGNAGILTFGNFNQYNTFNNCTVSGNGNIQFFISGSDVLHLAQDSGNSVNGGTFTANSQELAMWIEGGSAYIHNATFNGPGGYGIYLGTRATYACVNSNTFNSGLGTIGASAYNDLGSGNNPNNGNLTPGTCP